MKRNFILMLVSALLVFSLSSAFAKTSTQPTAKAKSQTTKACRMHKDCKKMKHSKKAQTKKAKKQ